MSLSTTGRALFVLDLLYAGFFLLLSYLLLAAGGGLAILLLSPFWVIALYLMGPHLRAGSGRQKVDWLASLAYHGVLLGFCVLALGLLDLSALDGAAALLLVGFMTCGLAGIILSALGLRVSGQQDRQARAEPEEGAA